MVDEQVTAAEQELREAARGVNVAIRAERDLGRGGRPMLLIVDRNGREMKVSPELIKLSGHDERLAILAAFAAGATEIKWRDGSTLTLVIEPPPPSDKPVDSDDTGE